MAFGRIIPRSAAANASERVPILSYLLDRMELLVLSSDALLVALRADVKLRSGDSPRLRLPPMAPPSSYIYWCVEAKSGVCALGYGGRPQQEVPLNIS